MLLHVVFTQSSTRAFVGPDVLALWVGQLDVKGVTCVRVSRVSRAKTNSCVCVCVPLLRNYNS